MIEFCQPAEVEKCLCMRPADSNIGSNDSIGEVCDSQIGSGNMMKMSPSLHSASALASDWSRETEELCVYVCDVCTRQCRTAVALRCHRQQHKDCATCTECGQGFHSLSILRHHLLIQCPRRTVVCNICQQSFVGWPNLAAHTSTTHPTVCLCPFCTQAFLRVDQLVQHRMVHATNIYQCLTCPRSFRSQKCANIHIMKHAVVGKDKHFPENHLNKDGRERHVSESQLNPVIEDPFVSLWKLCELTGDECASKTQLKEVNGDNACLSGHVLNGIVRDDDINYHQEEVTGAAYVSQSPVKGCKDSQLVGADFPAHREFSMPLHGCALPAAASDSKGNLDVHRVMLHFDKQVPSDDVLLPKEDGDVATKAPSRERVTCGVCSRRFRRLSDLHVHLECHTGEMRFKCHVCGRPFRKSGTLARHLRIHTGDTAVDRQLIS